MDIIAKLLKHVFDIVDPDISLYEFVFYTFLSPFSTVIDKGDNILRATLIFDIKPCFCIHVKMFVRKLRGGSLLSLL